MTKSNKTIHVIGINSYDFDDLSLNLRKLIIQTKNIAIPKSYFEKIINWFENQSKKDKVFLKSDSNEELINWLKKCKEDSILITRGDPLWFGIGRILLENFDKDEITFYPSNTCVQLACSKLKIPWQEITLVSIHGRETDHFVKALKSKKSSLAIITDTKNGLGIIKRNLIELKLEDYYEFWICEEIGFKNENIRLFEVKDDLPENISTLNIVLLLQKEKIESKDNQPLFGINDNCFKTFEDRPNLITKREIRIQILADLELPETGVLWDIGAGSGTIGLEALKLRPNLKLFAIDKRFGTKNIILENAKRLGVIPHAVIEKDINKLLNSEIDQSLVPPDRVIIGGCNNKTKLKIINFLQKFKSKKIIVVIPLITLEILGEIKDLLNEFKYAITLNQIQIYKSLSISEGTRFEPNNPVFLIKAEKI